MRDRGGRDGGDDSIMNGRGWSNLAGARVFTLPGKSIILFTSRF